MPTSQMSSSIKCYAIDNNHKASQCSTISDTDCYLYLYIEKLKLQYISMGLTYIPNKHSSSQIHLSKTMGNQTTRKTNKLTVLNALWTISLLNHQLLKPSPLEGKPSQCQGAEMQYYCLLLLRIITKLMLEMMTTHTKEYLMTITKWRQSVKTFYALCNKRLSIQTMTTPKENITLDIKYSWLYQ
jgi:hypothetical protein